MRFLKGVGILRYQFFVEHFGYVFNFKAELPDQISEKVTCMFREKFLKMLHFREFWFMAPKLISFRKKFYFYNTEVL
jgi:hypothetical protein